MGFYLRPGVFIKERDLTQIIAAVATSIGAVVGSAKRGTANKPMLMTTKQEVIDEFGTPALGNYFHDAALAFLEKANMLYMIRVTNDAKQGGLYVVGEDIANAIGHTAMLAGVTDPENIEFESIDQVVSASASGVTYSGILANAPIKPGSVTLTFMQTAVLISVTDTPTALTGVGTFVNANLETASPTVNCINYATGAYQVTFKTHVPYAVGPPIVPEVGVTAATEIMLNYDSAALFLVYQKDPGVWGNSILIDIDNVNRTGGTFDLVVKEAQTDGTFLLRERFTVSRDPTAKDGYGLSQYIENVVNTASRRSQYIRVLDNDTLTNRSVLPKSNFKTATRTAGFTGAMGDGTETYFTGTISGVTDAAIKPGTVLVTAVNTAGTVLRAYANGLPDDGDAEILKGDVDTPEIADNANAVDDTTGVLSITFSSAMKTATDLVIIYQDLTSWAEKLAGGSDDTVIFAAQINAGWDLLANPDEYDVNLLINAGYAIPAIHLHMIALAEARQDCFAILDPPYGLSVQEMVEFRKYTGNYNSSYAAIYYDWLRVFDDFNAVERVTPPSGYVASSYAFTDLTRDPWVAPAGMQRGVLQVLETVTRLSPGDMDLLYSNGINPMLTQAGGGTYIWGQKTLLYMDSALNRVNVRRLLIVLEKAISKFLRAFVFEPNVQRVRNQIVVATDNYLANVQARDGISGRLVVSNASNNTPQVIDNNELHVDIYIKPVRAAEFIQLGVVVLPTGAEFDEAVAQLGGAI